MNEELRIFRLGCNCFLNVFDQFLKIEWSFEYISIIEEWLKD